MDPRVKKGKAPAGGLICLCNAIPRSRVEAAIRDGADSLGKLFDRTCAGVGACGGTCQPNLKALLESYQLNGEFPPPPSIVKKRRRRGR